MTTYDYKTTNNWVSQLTKTSKTNTYPLALAFSAQNNII